MNRKNDGYDDRLLTPGLRLQSDVISAHFGRYPYSCTRICAGVCEGIVCDRRYKLQEDIQVRPLCLLEKKSSLPKHKPAKRINAGGTDYFLKSLIRLGCLPAAADNRLYLYVLALRRMADATKVTRLFLARNPERYTSQKRAIAAMQIEPGRHSLACGEVWS